jgi:hypothetical protein
MVRAFRIRALFSDFDENKAEDSTLKKTVEEIYFVTELFEAETDSKKKEALKIAFDEFQKYKNENPERWERIRERYSLISETAAE